MRIGIAAMHFSQPGDSGGLNVYVRSLVEALAEFDSSHRYSVFLFDYGVRSWSHRTWPDNVKLITLQSTISRSPEGRIGRFLQKFIDIALPGHIRDRYIAAQIDRQRLDVIHFPATTIKPISIHTPCILTLFDLQHEYYPEFFAQAEVKIRSRAYRKSVHKAVRVIVPSSYTAQSLMDKYKVAPDKLANVPVGIDAKWRRADTVTVERVRSKYGLPGEYIIYPANPWPHKNHKRLLTALALIRQRFGVVPTLVTTGRLRNEQRTVSEMAVAVGVDQHVVDLGFIPADDLSGLYSGAKAMVFPSLFEGFGMPLLEAMACGCPIAAADATAIPECVGDAALLFDPQDPDAIADTVQRLATQPELANALVAKGFRRVQHYSWKNIVPQLGEVYATVK